jgi:hypothetical protein
MRRTKNPRDRASRRSNEDKAKAEVIRKMKQTPWLDGADATTNERLIGVRASTHFRACSCDLCQPGPDHRQRALNTEHKLWCQEELAFNWPVT